MKAKELQEGMTVLVKWRGNHVTATVRRIEEVESKYRSTPIRYIHLTDVATGEQFRQQGAYNILKQVEAPETPPELFKANGAECPEPELKPVIAKHRDDQQGPFRPTLGGVPTPGVRFRINAHRIAQRIIELFAQRIDAGEYSSVEAALAECFQPSALQMGQKVEKS